MMQHQFQDSTVSQQRCEGALINDMHPKMTIELA